MKNKLFLSILLMTGIFSLLSCDQERFVLSESDTTASDFTNHVVSERTTCEDCESVGDCCLIFDVEVANWSSVGYVTFQYTKPDGSTGTIPVTSVVSTPIVRCGRGDGSILVLMGGGPASAFVRLNADPTDGEFFFVNNSSSSSNCSVDWFGCNWDEGSTSCGGFSQ